MRYVAAFPVPDRGTGTARYSRRNVPGSRIGTAYHNELDQEKKRRGRVPAAAAALGSSGAASQHRTAAALGPGSDASTNGASKRAQLHTLRKWASSPV